MFRTIILPIFRSTRLYVTVCCIMHPRCCRPVAGNIGVHYTTSCNTQSSASKDGQNNCPKHVELTGIINKPLLLHLFGCLHYLYQSCTAKEISDNQIYLLIKYIKSALWRVAKRMSYIQDARCLMVNIGKKPFSVRYKLIFYGAYMFYMNASLQKVNISIETHTAKIKVRCRISLILRNTRIRCLSRKLCYVLL